MSADRVHQAVAQVLELLAREDYAGVEAMTRGTRLSAAEMRWAIEQYGRTVVPPPPEIYDYMDVMRITASVLPAWSVTLPLWTAQEGRSDLSLELTIIEGNAGLIVELDDLHVL